MRLENKIAVITGAGSGIGKATAEKMAREGAMVVVSDYNGDEAEKTARELEQQGHQVILFPATSGMKKRFRKCSGRPRKNGAGSTSW